MKLGLACCVVILGAICIIENVTSEPIDFPYYLTEVEFYDSCECDGHETSEEISKCNVACMYQLQLARLDYRATHIKFNCNRQNLRLGKTQFLSIDIVK